MTKTLPQDILSDLQKRRKGSVKLMGDGGTAESISQLLAWWKVRTFVKRNPSLNQRIVFSEKQIARLRERLQKLTLENDLREPLLRRNLSRSLQSEVLYVSNLKASAATDPAAADKQETYFVNPYKQRAFLQTPHGRCQIAYDPATSSIAVSQWMPTTEILFVKSLLDLPFNIGAELHLIIESQGKEIDLHASDNY